MEVGRGGSARFGVTRPLALPCLASPRPPRLALFPLTPVRPAPSPVGGGREPRTHAQGPGGHHLSAGTRGGASLDGRNADGWPAIGAPGPGWPPLGEFLPPACLPTRGGGGRDGCGNRPSIGLDHGTLGRGRHVRSTGRCSLYPAIHTPTRILLRSSSTHEPSDPPLRVVSPVNWRAPRFHGPAPLSLPEPAICLGFRLRKE